MWTIFFLHMESNCHIGVLKYNCWMIRLRISDIDREAIGEALDDPSVDERSKRKLLALRMHELGVPHCSIAKTLNVSDDTITNYLNLYEPHSFIKIGRF